MSDQGFAYNGPILSPAVPVTCPISFAGEVRAQRVGDALVLLSGGVLLDQLARAQAWPMRTKRSARLAPVPEASVFPMLPEATGTC